ncbi:hypothetical protein HPP92_023822 [Vanilla planifolia]|uniref:Uncharacterized protein n=1 Tax=Vanilla planifolia TaxID=51239 RepID=A0A835PLC3_VANPL|nr:hypothetical protein HPP92_023822 [Vanilla planifolia]
MVVDNYGTMIDSGKWSHAKIKWMKAINEENPKIKGETKGERHLLWRAFIIASTATKEEMLRWFNEHVVWNDKQLNLKLLRRGILTRIYAPMAIIRGLRDSGVFASAIASARSRPRQRPSTVENLQNRSSESKSTASRRILGAESSLMSAVPPLPPPGLADLLPEA